MIDAQTILKMIEAVDPADTAKLDEIDARADHFINWPHTQFCDLSNNRFFYRYKSEDQIEVSVDMNSVKEYTRSRDALKAIRPKGWVFEQKTAGEHYTYWGRKSNTLGGCVKLVASPALGSLLITEELAELHAVIQAIDYDRSQI